jgi:subfamily B ATP-binding cassette protein MsbA
MVMHDGRLVEEGSHRELIAKENGYYKKLYEIQLENQ